VWPCNSYILTLAVICNSNILLMVNAFFIADTAIFLKARNPQTWTTVSVTWRSCRPTCYADVNVLYLCIRCHNHERRRLINWHKIQPTATNAYFARIKNIELEWTSCNEYIKTHSYITLQFSSNTSKYTQNLVLQTINNILTAHLDYIL